MVMFVKGQEVVATAPTVQVDNKFTPGTYTFSLVVTDASGNASAPALLKVVVLRPVLAPTDPSPVVPRPPG
jgi:hypothetical protein